MTDKPPPAIDLDKARAARKAVSEPEYCYTCRCGNQVFVLRLDARLECAHCSEIQWRLLWGSYFTSPSPQGLSSSPIPPLEPYTDDMIRDWWKLAGGDWHNNGTTSMSTMTDAKLLPLLRTLLLQRRV